MCALYANEKSKMSFFIRFSFFEIPFLILSEYSARFSLSHQIFNFSTHFWLVRGASEKHFSTQSQNFYLQIIITVGNNYVPQVSRFRFLFLHCEYNYSIYFPTRCCNACFYHTNSRTFLPFTMIGRSRLRDT